MTIGENLKRARTKMNLELDEVAQKTKIAKMYLIALENDDLASMPGGVYTRNFLRTYAKFLNLDEDILTAEFHEQYAVKPHFVLQQEQAKADDLMFQKQRRFLGVFVAVVVVILAIVAWFMTQTQSDFGVSPAAPAPVTASQSESANGQAPAPPAESFDEDQSTQDDAPATQAPVPPSANEPNNDPEPTDAQATPGEPDPTPTDTSGPDQSPPVPDDAANEADVPDAGAQSEADTVFAEPQTLPLANLEGVDVLPEGAVADGLEDVWAIEALGTVWVEITVDGQILTQRNLRQGMVRVYKYGTSNTLIVGDAGLVAVQDGARVRKRVGASKSVVTIRYVGQGEMLSAIEDKVGPLPEGLE